MPFKSQAQRGFMYSQKPKLAAKFEKETPKGKKLPKHKQTSGVHRQVAALKSMAHAK